MIYASPERFPSPLPHKYRAQHAAALALVVMIVYLVQLMVGIAQASVVTSEEPKEIEQISSFHMQNTSLVYR